MSVQAVIFDFGGVLCFHPSDEQYGRLAKVLGLDIPTTIRAFWEDRVPYDAARVDSAGYWKGVAAKTGSSSMSL